MSRFLKNIDLTRNQLLNAVTQNLATAPTSPVVGLRYYDTTLNSEYFWNGTAWISCNAALLSGTIPNTALATNPLARANHTGTQVAATISDLATVVQAYKLNQFAAPNANIPMGGFTLTGLNTAPNASGQAAEYSWVLNQIQTSAAGLDAHPSVIVVSTTNQATLTGLLTIDGVTLTTGQRILLVAQTTATQNGVYTVAAGAWTRDVDVISPQSFWFTEQGTVGAGTQWKVSTSGTIVIGTTSIVISQFGAAVNYSAGNGLQLASTVFSILLNTNSGLAVSGSGLTIQLATNPGLQLAAGGVSVLTPGSSGILVGSTGVTIDTTIVARKGSATIGDGASTVFAITHNLGTFNVLTQVQDVATHTDCDVDIVNTSINVTTVTFTGLVPAANTYIVTCLG